MNTSVPKVTVVTPSYNQGEYIESTIRSVLLQNYPNLEYIVMDGGSTDKTLEVIERYDDQIDYWESKPDRGQTHAINKGFERARGDILCWLNSDDFFLSGALKYIGNYFLENESTSIVSGAGISYDQSTKTYQPHRACQTGVAPGLLSMLTLHGNVIQHSTFWRAGVMTKVGKLDEKYDYAMDHEFFLRCVASGEEITVTDKCLASFRRHKDQKTQENGSPYVREADQCKEPYIGTSLMTSNLTLSAYSAAIKFYRKHINTHPRLGLAPTCRKNNGDAWLIKIGVE